MPDAKPMALDGQGRLLAAGAPGVAGPVRLTLDEAGFTLSRPSSPPLSAAYRDLVAIAVQPGAALLQLGDGPDAVRVVLEQFGDRLGTVIGELRQRRARQRLTDRLVQLADDPLPAVEYRRGDEHGVGLLARQPWALELLPFDERQVMHHIRRADIASVESDPATGSVRISVGDATEPAGAAPVLELLGLGAAVARQAADVTALRDGAFVDASTLVAGLLPDAPFGTRQRLGQRLVDGRPAPWGDLGGDAALLEPAVLSEPTFAASYRILRARGGTAPVTWFAMAPTKPGGDERKAWFLVALPGNLVALELVSEGAHATYCFRVAPRAGYDGRPPSAGDSRLDVAVRAISAALIDARFLREPMALPADQLATARYLRYRLALAALPSLAEARRRFVARIVHTDDATWTAALDDLVAWHATARDEAAEWPGRADQEAAVLAAGGDDADATDADDGETAPADAGTRPADPDRPAPTS